MSNPFAEPAPPGEGITWADHQGRLLLIEPKEFETGITTKFGESDAVRADVTILDGENKGETYSDTLIFPKLLISQTKSKLGEKVLGRLTQGVSKSNQSPPWLLDPASPEDVQTGVRFLEYREKNSVSQPDQPSAGDQWSGKQTAEEPVPF